MSSHSLRCRPVHFSDPMPPPTALEEEAEEAAAEAAVEEEEVGRVDAADDTVDTLPVTPP
jgi:hypothetical protein